MKGEDANRRASITNSRHEPGNLPACAGRKRDQARGTGTCPVPRHGACPGLRPRRATTTGTTYDFAAATATPHFFCTDIGCGALTGYTYTGAGTCSAGCAGVPPSPLDATLAFSVVRTFPQITLGTAAPVPDLAWWPAGQDSPG